MSGENQELHVDFQLEPDILLGFHQVANPARMNEDQLLNWLDDFGTRMMTLSNPKPKDLIFHPNKHNPYITVTGGLRTIKDIYMEPGGKTTEKIARALIKLAQNPSVNAQIDKNGGRLDTLDLDLSYRTKAGRRFRVNLADSFDWESENTPLITMRLLPEKPFTMEDLRMPPVIRQMVSHLKMGLILICGTTGRANWASSSASNGILPAQSWIRPSILWTAAYWPKKSASKPKKPKIKRAGIRSTT